MLKRPRLFLALIILASAAVYLIGNGSVALWDRDEPRYAQTSRQMLQTGDWVVPHYLDNIRTAKPVFIYWCQAGAMKMLGNDGAFEARLPSAVATAILLIVLSIVLWRRIGVDRTMWTVFIFATSGLTIAAAKMCITDAVLLLWVTIAQICLYAIWRGDYSWRVVMVFSIAIGLAALTKGPVIFGFQAMTLLILGAMRLIDSLFVPNQLGEDRLPLLQDLDQRAPSNTIDYRIPPQEQRKNREIGSLVVKCIVAVAIITAITLPWVLMVQHRASAFLKTAVGHDVWDRMMTPLEQHAGPPGYYLLTIWLTYFPWSLLLPLTIGLAIRYRAHPQTRFALAAIIGPWIMLECVRTKLPHYLLPVFPPLAFLTADAIVQNLQGQHDDMKRRGFLVGVGVWAALVALASASPWVIEYRPLPFFAMAAMTTVGVALAAAVLIAFLFRRIVPAIITMGLGTLAIVAIAYGAYFPYADFLRLSPRIAGVLIANGVMQPHQVIMMRYMEPSLAFHQGGTIREAGDLTLTPRWLPQLPPWIVVEQSVFDHAPAEVREQFDIVASLHGLAYADRSTWMTVLVIHRK